MTNKDFGESPGFNISPANGDTTEDGAVATFTVRLTSQPTANVTIPVLSSDQGEGSVSPSSLTFTPENWDSNQAVTITGRDDLEFDNNQPFPIILGEASSNDADYNGKNPDDITLQNIDNDVFSEKLVPELVYPVNGATGVETSLSFQWEKVESEDEEIQYHIIYCEDQNFNGCEPEKDVTQKVLYMAGIGTTGAGFLFAGFMFAGGIRDRKYLNTIVVLLMTGMLLTAYGSGGGSDGGGGRNTPVTDTSSSDDTNSDDTQNGDSSTGDASSGQSDKSDVISYAVTGLKSGTTYYWKAASERKGELGVSEVRSFTTED